MRNSGLLLSYPLAALAGWAATLVLSGTGVPPRSPVQSAPTEHRASAAASPVNGMALLERLRQPCPPSMSTAPVSHEEYLRLFEESKAQLPPTVDPGEAFLRFFRRHRQVFTAEGSDRESAAMAQLAAYYSAWFFSDPDAAMHPGNSFPSDVFASLRFSLNPIITDFVEQRGIEPLMKIEWNMDLDSLMNLQGVIISDIARRGSMEDLRRIERGDCPLRFSKNLGFSLGASWPLDDRENLLIHLHGTEGEADAARMLARRMEGSSGPAWILDMLAAGKLGPEAARTFANPRGVEALVAQDGVPIETRGAILRQLDPERDESDEQLATSMLPRRLQGFLDGDGDWLYAVRHGAITAHEILQEATQAMPDFHPYKEALRNQLVVSLADQNPQEAMTLLEGLPDDEVARIRADVARSSFRAMDPEDFLAWVRETPLTGDPHQERAFTDAWRVHAANDLRRYGTDYLQWVKELPPGPHRNWALDGMLEHLDAPYPKLRAEISAARRPNE